jgi:hypothetical protein
MATNGPAAEREWRCRAAATSSLPVPLSPTISTGASVGAARAIRLKTSCIGGLAPSNRSPPVATASGTAARFDARAELSARRTTSTTCSSSNGLVK